jgi:hypothetical protein
MHRVLFNLRFKNMNGLLSPFKNELVPVRFTKLYINSFQAYLRDASFVPEKPQVCTSIYNKDLTFINIILQGIYRA